MNVEHDEPEVAQPRFDSVRSRLTAKREEIRARKDLDLLIPSYGGELAIRYHAIPEEEFQKIAGKISGGVNQGNVNTALDLLIKACTCILVREGEDLEPLVDDDDKPIRFDPRLAEFFGFEATKARDVVKGVFSPDGKLPLAPGPHALSLVEWMQGNDAKIDQDLLGE